MRLLTLNEPKSASLDRTIYLDTQQLLIRSVVKVDTGCQSGLSEITPVPWKQRFY